MPESRSWCVNGDGKTHTYVYVQSNLGNYAMKTRIPPVGGLLEVSQRPHIAAGLTDLGGKALFFER